MTAFDVPDDDMADPRLTDADIEAVLAGRSPASAPDGLHDLVATNFRFQIRNEPFGPARRAAPDDSVRCAPPPQRSARSSP